MTAAFPTISRFVLVEQFVRQPKAPPLIRHTLNSIGELRRALEEDASQIEEEFWGCTPLITAAAFGHVECLELLLSKRAMPDGNGEDGRWTPIQVACLRGNHACVRALLAAGASARPVDDSSYTPLQCAAEKDSLECVEALFAVGAAEMEPMDRGHWALSPHASTAAFAVLPPSLRGHPKR